MKTPKLNNSADVEILSFDKYQIALPKGDLKKEWEKLKKYMDIKLEDYKYEEPVKELEKVKNIEEEPEPIINRWENFTGKKAKLLK